jgi:hypothetical protein
VAIVFIVIALGANIIRGYDTSTLLLPSPHLFADRVCVVEAERLSNVD